MQLDKNIILHSINQEEFEELVTKIFREQFVSMNKELQMVLGEDDLISSGTACRLLGVSTKVLKYLIDEGYFTVFYHLRERRFRRADILEYRNKYRAEKRRH